jgi:hypothetical protein
MFENVVVCLLALGRPRMLPENLLVLKKLRTTDQRPM